MGPIRGLGPLASDPPPGAARSSVGSAPGTSAARLARAQSPRTARDSGAAEAALYGLVAPGGPCPRLRSER